MEFNFKILNGGELFERKHYRCSVSDWRGWEEELIEGRCPVNTDEGVIENPIKFFTSYNGRLDSSYSNVFPAEAYLSVHLLRNNINASCQEKMKFKIDGMSFSATGTYGNDVIIANPYCCYTYEGDPQPRCHDAQADLDAQKPNLQLGGAVTITVVVDTGSEERGRNEMKKFGTVVLFVTLILSMVAPAHAAPPAQEDQIDFVMIVKTLDNPFYQTMKKAAEIEAEKLGVNLVFTAPARETDLEEQRRAYVAFVRTWNGAAEVRGVYWWNWFGFGGEKDTNYTPRKKPAAEVIRRWYQRPGAYRSDTD